MKKTNSMQRKEARAGFLFILPWIIGFIAFLLGPSIVGLGMAFTDWTLLTPPRFVGLDNFSEMIIDPLFWKSLKITLVYTLFQVPLGVLVGFSIALLLNNNLKLQGLWRSIYYFPSIISGVAVSLMWMWLFNPDFGILNILLEVLGIDGIGWIYDTQWALPSLILMSLWSAGGSMIIYLAGLQQIPTSLYEAASLDGAGNMRQFLHITIPMISPVLLFNLIMNTIISFQSFTEAFIMTGGGPNNATMMYALNLYNNAFKYFRMGYASGLSWILLMIILFFTILILKTSYSWVFYQDGSES